MRFFIQNRNPRRAGLALGLALGLSPVLWGQSAPTTSGHGLKLLQQAALALGAAPHNLDLQANLLTRPGGSSEERQGKLEIKLLLPDMYQRTTKTQLPFGSFGMVQTLNGGQFWTHMVRPMGGGPGAFFRRRGSNGRQLTAAERKRLQAEMRARQLATLQEQFARAQIVFLMKLPAGFAVHYGGIAQAANGAKAEWLKLSGANDFSALLFLDPKTQRPLMMQYQGIVPRMPANFRGPGGPGGPGGPDAGGRRRFFMRMMKPQTVELHFSHWRKVQGHWFPMRLVKTSQGQVFEQLDIKTIQLDSNKLTPKQFAKS